MTGDEKTYDMVWKTTCAAPAVERPLFDDI